jgi:carbamoyl-phosphate synthase large subunit
VWLDRYLEGIEVDVDALFDGERLLVPGLMEHVERAGVHSGDSLGIYPHWRIDSGVADRLVDDLRRVAVALGVRGLVNAQFIVRDDGTFLLEVNPRASRTVPVLSKVTGVPMVELATRIALGETLGEMGWPDGLLPPGPFTAVKSPVFSASKLRGVDPVLGPAMRSTGEVVGIHEDPRVAMAKALLAASLRPPVPEPPASLALLSVADRDKAGLAELGEALAAAGYGLAATRGTARELRRLGHSVREVARIDEAHAAGEGILDVIASGEVALAVNTPSPEPAAVTDASRIRVATVREGIVCFTTIETAIAGARSLDPAIRAAISQVRPLHEWQACAAGARVRASGRTAAAN